MPAPANVATLRYMPVSDEVTAALSDLLGAPLGAETADVSAVWRHEGVEIAIHPVESSDQRLRQVWSTRQGGSATPLVLVAPRTGKLAVLGPLDARGPIREVETQLLVEVLSRIGGLGRRQAAATLAASSSASMKRESPASSSGAFSPGKCWTVDCVARHTGKDSRRSPRRCGAGARGGTTSTRWASLSNPEPAATSSVRTVSSRGRPSLRRPIGVRADHSRRKPARGSRHRRLNERGRSLGSPCHR